MDADEVAERREAFRLLARGYADQTTKLLADEDERSTIYAALELRFALEALAYDLACNYLEELGETKTLEWQAPKLIERLKGIDPWADNAVYVTGVHPETGEKVLMGTDMRMDLRKLKQRYQKLNSALHAPTIAKVESGKPRDMKRLRADCLDVLSVVELVLASTAMVGGGTHYPVFQMNCQCGKVIKRRTDPLFVHRDDPTRGAEYITVRCWKCENSVQLSLNGNNYEVSHNIFNFDCPHDGCGGENKIWQKDMVDGFKANCEHCGGAILMSTALRPVAV
jgi:hypothetical protein